MRIVTEAGYSKPTPLQKKVIPLILKGKHVAVQAGDQTGKTAAILLPLIHRVKKSGQGTKILIMTEDLDNSKKYFKFFKIFAAKRLTHLNAVILGDEKEPKKEFKMLLRKPDVIIGPSKRIIDHIRRDNVTFESLQTIVIDSSGQLHSEIFEPDAQFILSKVGRKVQRIYFSNNEITGNAIYEIIKRPVIVNKIDWLKTVASKEHVFFYLNSNEEKLILLYKLLLAGRLSSGYIFCNNNAKLNIVKHFLLERNFKVDAFDPEVPLNEQDYILNNFRNKKSDFLIFNSSLDLSKANLSFVDVVINYDEPYNLAKQLKYIIANAQDSVEIISFLPGNYPINTNELQEINKLNTKTGEIPAEERILEGLITKMVASMKEDEDSGELSKIKKLIKKNVPLFSRGDFMAYLLKDKLNKPGGAHRRRRAESSENKTRLFITIGRNRKVFPKNLIHLFTTRLNISRGAISNINILDNYSFIEIDSSLAQRAIDELSGTNYKGRKIAVNFARKKDNNRPAAERS